MPGKPSGAMGSAGLGIGGFVTRRDLGHAFAVAKVQFGAVGIELAGR